MKFDRESFIEENCENGLFIVNFGNSYDCAGCSDLKGCLKINLVDFMPAPIHDFKILIDTVRRSDDPERKAKVLYDYISGMVEDFKAYRDGLADSQTTDINKMNIQIRKYLKLADEITKYFDFDKMSDDNAQIKYTAAKVYAMCKDSKSGQTVIKVFDGWTFEKYGIRFDVYKQAPGRYPVLMYGTGVAILYTKNKNKAADEITEKWINTFRNNKKSVQQAAKEFNELMEKSGYTTGENKKSEKKTSKNENKKSEKKTSENKTNQEEKTMKKNENKTETRYFDNVKNLEELRTVYKDLLKANHPDNGGDTAIMQEINRQYDERREYLKSHAKIENEKDAAKWSDVEDAAIREALYKVVHLKNINIEIVGCWIWVDGDTFTNKQALREAGYKWSNNRKKWHFAPYEKKYYKGGHESFDSLRRKYGSVNVESEEQEAIAQ